MGFGYTSNRYFRVRTSATALAAFAISAAIRRTLSRSASYFFCRTSPPKLLLERAGGLRIGKTPPKIDLVFYDNSPSVPHLNFSGTVKVDYPAAHLDVQFVFRNGKLDDVGIFALVFDRLPAEWLAHHNGPCVYLRNNSGSLAIFAAIRRASSFVSSLAADRRCASSIGSNLL